MIHVQAAEKDQKKKQKAEEQQRLRAEEKKSADKEAKRRGAKRNAAPPHKRVLAGARVRVKCSDGAHYEGVVSAWDAQKDEWTIVLDDGACGVCMRARDAGLRASSRAGCRFPAF